MKVDNLESLGAYFDDELSAEEVAQIEAQIQTQAEVRNQLEAFKHDSTMIKQFPRVNVPFDLTASILELAGKVQPCPFALADSPIGSEALNDSVMVSRVDGESESVSISRDSENVPYEDDWKPPTIGQRIVRAMLWPMLVLMIAMGMYMANPSSNPVVIQTTPDESEMEESLSKEGGASASVSYIQASNANSPEVDTVQVKNNVVSNSEPQIVILCKIDAQKFTNEQWYALLDSFGVKVDKSKDPLEVKSWTVNLTTGRFNQLLSAFQSAPGILSVQSENADAFKTRPEKTSANVVIRLVVDEL